MGSCQGRLTVGEEDVRYETGQRNHARIWPYSQLRRAESSGPRRLSFATYEDQNLPLRGDRTFNFELLDGDASDELLNFLLGRVGRRSNSGPPEAPPGGRYELAVKHIHTFGGCQGTLRITPVFIEYVTNHSRDARLWKYLDIKQVKPEGTYRLFLYTYEDQLLLFGRDRTFKFDLKEPLEPAVNEFIQSRLRP